MAAKVCTILGSVGLYQLARDKFTVKYGQQVAAHLTYSEAAFEFGRCVMHELACEGKLDNREKGER